MLLSIAYARPFPLALLGGALFAQAGEFEVASLKAGLDQVNVLLPHSLAGSGDSIVTLYAAGVLANSVPITIQ